MKAIGVAIISILLLLFSCQKGIDDLSIDTATGTPIAPAFKAKIDGKQWNADSHGATLTRAANQGAGIITIAGQSNDGKLLAITLVDSGVHQYTLIPTGVAANRAHYQDSSMVNINGYTTSQAFISNAMPGTVTVINIDTVAKTISGTFSFVVYRDIDSTQISITDGHFTNIPLVIDPLPSANPTIDTFTVKIDDTLFTPYSITSSFMSVPGIIVLQAANQSQTKSITISFPAGITSGTFTFNYSGGAFTGLYKTGSLSFVSVSGDLEILENDFSANRIRGRFSFLAQQVSSTVPVHRFTEGYFSVIYR